MVPLPQIIPLVLHRAERDSPESVNLQNPLRAAVVRNSVDVGLLPHADLVADGVDVLLLDEAVEREVVEAAVGESVAVICAGLDLGSQAGGRACGRGAYTSRS